MIFYCTVVVFLWAALLGAVCMSFSDFGYATERVYEVQKKVRR